MKKWFTAVTAAILGIAIVSAGVWLYSRFHLQDQPSAPVNGAIFIRVQGGQHELYQ